MSELNNKHDEVILDDDDSQLSQTSEPVENLDQSDAEKEALATGWNPKGEKSAAEWNRNKKLYDENHKLKKALRTNQKKMDEMLRMYRKQEEAAYNKAYNDLQAEKEAAISIGNREMVHQAEMKQQQLEKPIPPEVIDFKDRYEDIFSGEDRQSKLIAGWVRGRDAELYQRGLNAAEHFKILESEMLEMFPELKGDMPKAKASAVDSGEDTRVVGNNRKIYRWSDLTPEQKKLGIDFEKRGTFTREEYVKELAKNGLIGIYNG